jgi:hypothetical protein
VSNPRTTRHGIGYPVELACLFMLIELNLKAAISLVSTRCMLNDLACTLPLLLDMLVYFDCIVLPKVCMLWIIGQSVTTTQVVGDHNCHLKRTKNALCNICSEIK